MWDLLNSQLSIEASVRLLELRQDSGEEQTHRCRRRSTSPRLKRSKGRHSRFPPTKTQQKRQIAALSIKTRIENSKTMREAQFSRVREQRRIFNLPLVRKSCERRYMSSFRSRGDENGKHI